MTLSLRSMCGEGHELLVVQRRPPQKVVQHTQPSQRRRQFQGLVPTQLLDVGRHV